MFAILMTSGMTTRTLFEEVPTYEEAYEICESYGWVFMEEAGGFEWDLEIVDKG